jgi:hypothetical protein
MHPSLILLINKMKRFYIAATIWCIVSISTFSQPVITADKTDGKIDFYINGKLFTSYTFSENEKYPFFFPVNGPSNASVTSMRNANYPHHSSLFFGCDRVNGGNYWQEGVERGQIVSLRVNILETGGEKAVIENECIWKREQADAPIKDKRRITISAPSADKFQIDFDITMEMLMDVTIEKTNHSLFSARIDPDLAVINGGTMIDSEGNSGEKGTFGKLADWIDCYGTRMNKSEGIAILQHPSNYWYPSPWFTRDYGFFSPTPMFWPPNNKNITLKKGESVKLRFRVIVHSGDHKEAKIADEFEKYKTE